MFTCCCLYFVDFIGFCVHKVCCCIDLLLSFCVCECGGHMFVLVVLYVDICCKMYF